MKTVNKVILIGNITKEPFVKITAGDKKVATFSVATNRYFKNPAGEPVSEAEYTNCVAWGPIAEQAEKFLTKGKLVYVEWHLKTRVIEKEDGTKIHKTEVVIWQLIFLSKREDFDSNSSKDDTEISSPIEALSGNEIIVDDFSDLESKF